MTAASSCQVDFYVLEKGAPDAGRFACRLAMMAWEKGHQVLLRARDDDEARALDELMWDFPPGRFLPHGRGEAGADAPVRIDSADSTADDRDLVINLADSPVPEPARYRRLLEIAPPGTERREASRRKYKRYRELGLNPSHHAISKT